ncbi:hypothetical protein ACC794_38070, partial [Rhizobium ruizarguesonis]
GQNNVAHNQDVSLLLRAVCNGLLPNLMHSSGGGLPRKINFEIGPSLGVFEIQKRGAVRMILTGLENDVTVDEIKAKTG